MTTPTKTWVFDLDNTLYCSSVELFKEIDKKIITFICETCQLSLQEAKELHTSFDQGTTLHSLIKNFNTDPQTFMDIVHGVNYDLLKPNPRLGKAIDTLKGDKFIFTNSSQAHSHLVLKKLQIPADIFTALCTADSRNHLFKPYPEAYQALIQTYHLQPEQVVFFDDYPSNLKEGKQQGFQTVWVRPLYATHTKPLPQVDICTDSLISTLKRFHLSPIFPRTNPHN